MYAAPTLNDLCVLRACLVASLSRQLTRQTRRNFASNLTRMSLRLGAFASCRRCDFAALDATQLSRHERWHGDRCKLVADGGGFACSRCPCRVTHFHHLKFHLQFHAADSKVQNTLFSIMFPPHLFRSFARLICVVVISKLSGEILSVFELHISK